jgi:hypothetical protein
MSNELTIHFAEPSMPSNFSGRAVSEISICPGLIFFDIEWSCELGSKEVLNNSCRSLSVPFFLWLTKDRPWSRSFFSQLRCFISLLTLSLLLKSRNSSISLFSDDLGSDEYVWILEEISDDASWRIESSNTCTVSFCVCFCSNFVTLSLSSTFSAMRLLVSVLFFFSSSSNLVLSSVFASIACFNFVFSALTSAFSF